MSYWRGHELTATKGNWRNNRIPNFLLETYSGLAVSEALKHERTLRDMLSPTHSSWISSSKMFGLISRMFRWWSQRLLEGQMEQSLPSTTKWTTRKNKTLRLKDSIPSLLKTCLRFPSNCSPAITYPLHMHLRAYSHGGGGSELERWLGG